GDGRGAHVVPDLAAVLSLSRACRPAAAGQEGARAPAARLLPRRRALPRDRWRLRAVAGRRRVVEHDRNAAARRVPEARQAAAVPKDARVASAISHWLPRFVSNGVLLADFEDVTGALERWEDWCAAWSRRAAVHEQLGRDELKEGHKLTGGEHLVRAGIYYHFAKFVFVHDLDQMRAAHMKAVECYRDGI